MFNVGEQLQRLEEKKVNTLFFATNGLLDKEDYKKDWSLGNPQSSHYTTKLLKKNDHVENISNQSTEI